MGEVLSYVDRSQCSSEAESFLFLLHTIRLLPAKQWNRKCMVLHLLREAVLRSGFVPTHPMQIVQLCFLSYVTFKLSSQYMGRSENFVETFQYAVFSW